MAACSAWEASKNDKRALQCSTSVAGWRLAPCGSRWRSALPAHVRTDVLWMVGLEGLWLPFGVLTFFFNFIPNVGIFGPNMAPLAFLRGLS